MIGFISLGGECLNLSPLRYIVGFFKQWVFQCCASLESAGRVIRISVMSSVAQKDLFPGELKFDIVRWRAINNQWSGVKFFVGPNSRLQGINRL